MSRFDTPDTIVGVGGTGKQVVTQFLEKDWILEGFFDSADGDVGGGLTNQLNAFSIDTDNNDSTLEQDRTDEERINSKIRRFSSQSDSNARAEYKFINLIEDTDQQYTNPSSLTNPDVVSEIVDDQGLDAWWLRRGRMMSDISNYAEGVIRKRALSKALYYASEFDAEPLSPMIQRAQQGNWVAMVVGLGGGTGSGLFLDIAKSIYEQSNARVTLFGVLPKVNSEAADIGANTHAALSELEHLSIDEGAENPFHNIVLLPLNPSKSDDYEEVDEALVHTMMSYYNATGNPDLQNVTRNFDESVGGVGPSRFAPFTVAVPQILEYPAGDIEESRKNVKQWISNKNTSLDAENTLYDEVESFLQDHYNDVYRRMRSIGNDGAEEFRLREEDIWAIYDDRLEPLEDLLQQPALSTLGYRSAEATGSAIKKMREKIKEKNGFSEELEVHRQLLSKVPERFESSPSTAQPDDGQMEAFDQDFSELMTRELVTIGRRRDFLRAIDTIEDETVTEALRSATSPYDEGVIGTEVDTKKNSVSSQLTSLESEVYDFEQIKVAAEDLLENEISTWESQTHEDISTFLTLRDNQSRIKELLSGLKSEIKKDLSSVQNDTHPSEVSDEKPDYSGYYAVDDLLNDLDAEPIGVQKIEESVDAIREARTYWLEEDTSSWVHNIKQAILGSRSDPFTGYQTARERIDSSLFTLSEWNEMQFSCGIREGALENRMSALNKREKSLIDDITQEFDNILSDCQPAAAKIESWLNSNQMADDGANGTYDVSDHTILSEIERVTLDGKVDSLRSDLKEIQASDASDVFESICSDSGIVKETLEALLVSPVNSELQKKRNKTKNIREDKKKFEGLESILLGGGTEFANSVRSLDAPQQIFVYDEPSQSYRYIKQLKPEEPGKILGNDDIGKANLWNVRSELTTIRNTLDEFIEDNVANSEYNALVETQVEYDGSYYDGHIFRNVLMSRMFDNTQSSNALVDEDNSIRDLRGTLENNFYISSGQYTEHKHGIGDPWSLTMTTFIGGIFLDNIAPATNNRRGYGTQYESRAQDLDEDTLIHHTHGVDGADKMGLDSDGAYVYRDSFVNLNKDEQAALLEGEQSVIETIQNKYQTRVGFDSTISRDND